ncbi:MAG: SMC-Scp complex subunit ScpB [Rubrobacteraceae bacterium]|uniref:SMC-Scp complex subunit ScpB n=1 Tax=Rubrobacter naiadicus TaxID=1392641 RepID=UPI0023609FD9|nr:SMC-Scp complex subunit ScpB [Rubrobacter naiadicus]MBX6764392.1 SMC-Scp complex subunit ScpB [Rubrobacteraceae bacterium]
MDGAGPEALVEAILLVSERPVEEEVLLSSAGLDRDGLERALSRLLDKYDARSSGVVLRRVAGGWQLATNPRCAEAIERFRGEARPTPLSGAAYEVLSCVLYLGPMTRGAISAVRGVNSDAVVRNLIERNLLAEVGADEESPGAPALLDVTEDFLIAASAGSREDFPPLEELVSEEELARVRERLKDHASKEP